MTHELATDRLTEVRGQLALALDVEDLRAARLLVSRVAPYFGVVKVGLELFIAVGPAAVEAFRSDGLAVFLDLKLHDIPTTVRRAASQARSIGATYLTVHAAGGEAMLRAAVEGFGPTVSGGILGVTVLTSDPEAPESVIAARAELAARTGCVGVVCAASDLGTVRKVAPGLTAVVPGIRLAGGSNDDQARAATPFAAASAGAGLLVVGRAVTSASDPAAAAREVAEQVAAAGSGHSSRPES
ncbi:MAG: orotidine-5'-phosphate decarboxylase [Acidimicrobiales bacterium]|jgi:orotidine-5'-phosphate decarboxylase